MDGRRRLLPLPPRPLTAHQPSGGSHGLHHLCLPQAVTDHSSASWTLFCATASIFLQLYLYPAVHISFSRSLFSRRQQHFPAVIYSSAEKCNSWLKSCYSVWAEHRQQIPAVPIQFSSVLLPPSFSRLPRLLHQISLACVLWRIPCLPGRWDYGRNTGAFSLCNRRNAQEFCIIATSFSYVF